MGDVTIRTVRVSVIIPSLNEAGGIAATIDSAFAAGAAEVIVSDGGSEDGTMDVARAHGATVLTGETMRARQLNRGAEAASHEALIFLHADTLLPADACDAVVAALQRHVFGGFRVRFIERTLGLRWTEFAINTRTRTSRCPWGDQAQFIRRASFTGFREIPIMDDYELAIRMKRHGTTILLPLEVRTSGRRFLENGLVPTTALNWLIVVSYRWGVDPERLARWYRGA